MPTNNDNLVDPTFLSLLKTITEMAKNRDTHIDQIEAMRVAMATYDFVCDLLGGAVPTMSTKQSPIPPVRRSPSPTVATPVTTSVPNEFAPRITMQPEE